jgi:hypothetical protein
MGLKTQPSDGSCVANWPRCRQNSRRKNDTQSRFIFAHHAAHERFRLTGQPGV